MAKILIVDDSKFMRGIIRETLESGGHTVVGEAENGADAITMFKEFRPDLVTMDVTMWGTDGIQALEEILMIDKDAKIVMVSALSEETMRSSTAKIQAKAYVTKPFTREVFLDTLKKVL